YEPQQPSYAQPAYEQPPSYAQPSPQGGQARADFAVGHQVVGADYDSIAASFPGDDPFEAEETRAFDPPPRGAARAIEPARAQPLSPPRAEPLPSPRAAAPAAPRANAGRMSIAQQRLSGQPRAGLASPPPRGVAESARAFHRQPTLIVKNPVAEPAQPAPAYDQGTPVRRAPVGLESRGVLTKERALMALALLGVIGLAWGATALLVGTPEEEGKPVVVVSEPAARQQTTLSIASSPSGAEVKLDGRALYESTPTQREVPPNQPLKVEILAEGYRPYETTVTLREGQTLALNPQLEARLGTLSIESDPSEASVYLNDRYVGRTPHTESEVSMKGPARLRLEKPGYLPREKTAEWEGHQTINLRLKLVAEPAAVAQLTPPPAAPEPPVASKKKKPRRRRRATPRPPDPPPRREEAPPPPPPPPRQEVGEGFLSVSSTPWGSVYLNGKLIANETPMIRQRVPEGSHRVYICYERNCNDRSGVKPARITAGRNTILKF
ncbi:PEGA domain-containing protein, partial [Myxococcota bacterium]|nr:PEGA domain-containing protein [Myxococcota bacterium]